MTSLIKKQFQMFFLFSVSADLSMFIGFRSTHEVWIKQHILESMMQSIVSFHKPLIKMLPFFVDFLSGSSGQFHKFGVLFCVAIRIFSWFIASVRREKVAFPFFHGRSRKVRKEDSMVLFYLVRNFLALACYYAAKTTLDAKSIFK